MTVSIDEQVRSATVLLAEDDPAILEGVADLLEIACQRFDITVIKTQNGRHALETMQNITPDLVISDLAMPEMDGYQFLTEVRKQDKWIHIPFVFLTAKVSKQEIHKGRLTGAELYITKPFESHELIELVESLLSKTFQQEETRTQRSTTLKREILRALQHEFRTPLTYVTAYFEILSMSYDETEDPQDLQEYLHGIQSGSQRLMRLAVDLIAALELSTGETADNLASEMVPVKRIGRMLESSVYVRQIDASGQKVTLNLEIEDDLPAVYGHPDSLQNVFDRMLDNAIKFTKVKNGGEVWISAESDAEATPPQLKITYRDNGIGFSNQVRDQLFEMFYQDGRDRWEQQGPGVGLAIAKGLVELHHGSIQANGMPDEGAEFTIRLPIYQAGDRFGSAERSRLKPATILAVEDDYYLLMGLTELLQLGGGKYDFNVLTASNGQEALDMLADVRPDIILSDVMMPVMDGYTFLENVRANKNLLDIPFVFLSARDERQDVYRGQVLGVDEYVTKPYDSDELISIIDIRLDRHFARKAAVSADFATLKSQILNSLEFNFLDSLSEVSTHSQKMTEQLEESETAADLKASLQGIQHGSLQLSELVDNFTTLVEFRTGAAQSAYELRRQAISDVGFILRDVSETILDNAEAVLGAAPIIPIDIHVADDLKPITADPTALDKTFSRLIQLAVQATDTTVSGARVVVSAESDKKHLIVTAKTTNSTLKSEQFATIQNYFADDNDQTLELDHFGSALTIIKQYIVLHAGEIDLAPDQNGFSITIRLPLDA